jgi:glycosyltransferase involved in cell wall biosynthesis
MRPFEVLVVDDGSRDRTPAILDEMAGRMPWLRILHQPKNLGYGAAIKRGIAESRGRYVVTIDSDGQFDPADIPRLSRRLEADRLDCVTGYRPQKKDTLPRVVANQVYNWLVRMLIGIRFHDAQCALKIFRGEVIRSINTEARGFTFPTEILVKFINKGYGVGEEEITHLPRVTGASTIRFFRTSRIMFVFLLYMRFKLFLFRSGILNDL